jgi:hypothetical protein
MSRRILPLIVALLLLTGVPAKSADVKLAIVPGGEPKPDALLALTEAKLFELKEIAMLERTEIDKVLAEQKLTGMFDAEHAVRLGQILKADIFAVLETTSIVIFDANTGLRFVDETLPEKIDDAVKIAINAVKTALEKRQKLAEGKLVTFGVLEVRNADFPVARDAWCRAVTGMLERSLLQRGGAVLERSRLQLVNKERALTGDATNALLSSMKQINLEFTRGETEKTFKISVRLGDEIFRAEGVFDKPLDAVHTIAEQLLESKDVTESDRNAEAARFLRESVFQTNHHRYEAALEKAEVAFALAPDNIVYRRNLVSTLFSQASDTSFPDSGWGNRGPNNPNLSKATVEQARQAIHLAERAQDLYESKNMESIFPIIRHILYGIYEKFSRLAKQFPELKGEINEFQRRALRHGMETRFHAERAKVTDRDQYLRFVQSALWDTLTYVFCQQSPPDLAEPFEMLIDDTLRSVEQWEIDIGESSHGVSFAGQASAYRSLLNAFIKTVALNRALPENERKKESDDIYERIIRRLEGDSRPMLQYYAWIARNKPYTLQNPPKALDYFWALKSRISEIPLGTHHNDYSVFYDELHRVVSSALGSNFVENGITTRASSETLCAHIMEFAASRDEIAEAPCFWLMQCLPGANLQTYNRQYLETIIPRCKKAIADQIAIAKKKDVAIAEAITARAVRDKWYTPPIESELENLPRLWKEEIVLIQEKEYPPDVQRPFATLGDDQILRPFFKGNRLYFFTLPHIHQLRLDSVDLETLKVERGKDVSNPISWSFGGGINFEALELHYYGSRMCPGFVDEKNAYFGMRKDGLRAIPLDGSETWTLTVEDGLPSGCVQAVGSINGKLYVGLGEENKGTWLIVVDLESRNFEILSSSTAKEGKAPFFDLSPPPQFVEFRPDFEQNRLLVSVRLRPPLGNTTDWSINGETGQFTKLESNVRPPNFADVICFKVIEYKGYLWGTFRTKGPGDDRVKPIMWGRIALDGKSPFEPLAPPKGFEALPPHLNFILPTPDGKGLLLCDEKSLILLRFDNPNP